MKMLMHHKIRWIPTSEVAFFAGLTDKDIHRVVDERVLPPSLVGSVKQREA
jgi:hypothetical protein